LNGYVERLLKKYNLNVIGKASDITSSDASLAKFRADYQKTIDYLNTSVTDSQAEKEFLISFFDYIYYT
jgi:hypothetical protein